LYCKSENKLAYRLYQLVCIFGVSLSRYICIVRVSKHYILIVLAGILLPLCIRGQTLLDTFKIKGANDEQLLNYYKFWEDKNDNASLKDVVNLFKQNQFTSVHSENPAFNSAYTKSSFWFVLNIKNDTTTSLNLMWSFYNNDIGFVIYELDSTLQPTFRDSLQVENTLENRNIPFRAMSYQFDLQPNQGKLFLAKVYKKNTDFIYFISDLSTSEDILLWENQFAFLSGKYVGILLVVIVFNLFLFLILKSRIYLWHTLYSLFILCFIFSEDLLDVVYLPSWIYMYFNKITKMNFLGFAMIFLVIVSQVFTESKTKHPRLDIVLRFYKFIMIGINVSLFLGSFLLYTDNIFLSLLRKSNDLFLFIGVLLVLFYSISSLVKKDYRLLIYFISSILLLTSILLYLITDFFGYRPYYLSPGNIIVAFIIQTIFLSLYFILKFNREQKDNYVSLKKANAENEKLSGSILKLQEIERKRFAQDLHDELGSSLAALKLRLQKSSLPKNELTEVLKIVDKASDDTRNISHNLMPPEFEQTNLESLLIAYYNRLNTESDVRFHFHCMGYKNIFGKEKELIIYRILMELTNNILKHANAGEATIQLIYFEKYLEMMCEDNGIGKKKKKTDGIGLNNINSRVSYIKGEIKIDTTQSGTTIIIKIPYNKNTNE